MKFVWEHNGDDTLLYATEYIGAYTRGKNLAVAMDKMQAEIEAYCLWSGQCDERPVAIEIIQDKPCNLQVADADSDVLFETERGPLSQSEYETLKNLVLKSAKDFYSLYSAVPDKHKSCLPRRKTFYGDVPRTAQEMYDHTKNVNAYYFGEIGIEADNDGTIYECRARGFELLEKTKNYLENPVIEGSYGEMWSTKKMLRRFLWHDRIHAKAMYRMATNTFGEQTIPNIYMFN